MTAHDVPPVRRVLTVDQVAAWDGPPLVLFVGVSTGGSLVHEVFGRWAAVLDRPWSLRGVDLPVGAPPEAYRELVAAMRRNPAVHGAVITAHKLRLYRACAPELAGRDRAAELAREVNALVTAGPQVTGYARDARSLAHVLPPLLRRAGAGAGADPYVLCFGAGGAATALLLALASARRASSAGPTGVERVPGSGGPLATGGGPGPGDPPETGRGGPAGPPARHAGRIVFADVDVGALDALRAVAHRAGVAVEFAHVRRPEDGDALLAALPGPALVVNATGLGKTAPGSPVTDGAAFGPATTAWDLNYRGPLTFLRQATARGAPVADGWDYFVAGWAGGLTAIAGTPFTGDLLARFARAAAPYRPRPDGRSAAGPGRTDDIR